MSQPRTVDIATEADWSWMQVPELYERVQAIAQRVAREAKTGGEDLEQDLMLHIAVRPALTERNWCDDDEINQFLSAVLIHARRIAKLGTANRWRIDYIEDSNEAEESWL